MGIRVSMGQERWNYAHDRLLVVSPERWDHLPEAVGALPGLYSNLLTFSAGPRVCIAFYYRRPLR